jgi:hypothetical protein
MTNIQIDPEFKSLIPPLAPEEYAQLESNLIDDGCRDPLVVWAVPPDDWWTEEGIIISNNPNADSEIESCYFTGSRRQIIGRCGKLVFVKSYYNEGEGDVDCGYSWRFGFEAKQKDSPYEVETEAGDGDYILIDGHNRFELCAKHKIPFETVPMVFEDRSHAKEWIIRNQFGRRNLLPYVRTKLALDLEETIAARSEQGKRTDLCQKSDNSPPLDTKRELATIAGVSHDTVAKVKKIEACAAPEVKAKLASGEVSINQAYQQIKKVIKETKRAEARVELEKAVEGLAQTEESDAYEVKNCSMLELIGSGVSIDCIISDPPYPKEFIHLYGELAKACSEANIERVAVMAGQSYLPQIIEEMCKHLQYRWIIAYMTPGGQAVQQWQAKVNTFWKPVIVFGPSEGWIGDVATSKTNDNDKRFHEWGQSESGMSDLVNRLSRPGETVCDPFMGAGTTGVVSLALGRKFIGCDIDASHCNSARKRLSKTLNEIKQCQK